MRFALALVLASCAGAAPLAGKAPRSVQPPVVLHATAPKTKATVAAPPKDDRTPLWLAAENGELATVKMLIAQGADIEAPARPYGSPLMAALEFDFEDVAVELLGAGAKADADTLALAARGDHVKLFPTIVARIPNWKPSDANGALLAASRQGAVDSIKAMLALKADVNTVADDGFTPLMLACASNRLDAARVLLAAGANVEGSLHWAVYATRASSIEYFPPRGGGPPFHGPPILAPDAKLVELVIAHKAKVDAVEGHTALVHAALLNAPAAVRVLIAHGANRLAKDEDGFTAEDIARKRGYSEVLRALTTK